MEKEIAIFMLQMEMPVAEETNRGDGESANCRRGEPRKIASHFVFEIYKKKGF